MPGRDPLVAEVAVDLVDPRDAADQEPLQEQLGRDAQIEVDVQRVVMRLERPRRGPPGDVVHHRRLDLEEAAGVEERPDGAHQRRAGLEDRPRLLVGGQVEIALPVADLDVGEAVPLLRHGPQRLREERQLVDHQRQLARAGADELPRRADLVAEVEVLQDQQGLLRELVLPDEELELLPAVVEVGEDDLPLLADRAHAAGDAQAQAQGLQLLGGRRAVLRLDVGGLQVPLEAVRIGRDTRRRQRLALLAPVLDLLVKLGHGTSLLAAPDSGLPTISRSRVFR